MNQSFLTDYTNGTRQVIITDIFHLYHMVFYHILRIIRKVNVPDMKKLYAFVAVLLSSAAMMAQGWPADYKGVMLQGFEWDSYADSRWTVLEGQADEISEYFSLVWVPNSAYAGSMSMNMGYHPVYWFKQDCAFGTKAQLRSMIKTYRDKGVGFIADVVINHRNGVGAGGSWVDFPAERYNGKTYRLGLADICSDDECANNGYKPTGAKDTGEPWNGARDLDHTSANVQENVKAYLDFLKNDIGYAGFRYDFVKGYAPKYNGMYNAEAKVEYSVGEYWDGNPASVKTWISSTRVQGVIQSAAFDFPLKYYINDAIGRGQWSRLAGSSLASDATYKRYSVTFVDNHDTYRDGNKCPANLEAANAYILTMPGTPCVFLNHWKAYKTAIKKMILIRRLAGISNTSLITGTKTYSAGYHVKVKGSNASVMCLLGNTGGIVPNGFKLALEGSNYKIYVEDKLDISPLDDLKDGDGKFGMPDCCTPEEGRMYAFFEVPSYWNTSDGIYCWCWNDGKNFTGGTWPGVPCTKVGTTDKGNEVWKWVGPASTDGTPTGIIFSVKGSPQTSDLDYHEGGYYDNMTGFLGDMSTSAIGGITVGSPKGNAPVGVYALTGAELRRCGAGIPAADAVRGLSPGMYIVGKRKVAVNQ